MDRAVKPIRTGRPARARAMPVRLDKRVQTRPVALRVARMQPEATPAVPELPRAQAPRAAPAPIRVAAAVPERSVRQQRASASTGEGRSGRRSRNPRLILLVSAQRAGGRWLDRSRSRRAWPVGLRLDVTVALRWRLAHRGLSALAHPQWGGKARRGSRVPSKEGLFAENQGPVSKSINCHSGNIQPKPVVAKIAWGMPAPHLVERYLQSMPLRYAQTFDAIAIEQHARTVFARGQRSANLGLFRSAGSSGTAICVVAPDRPGLLATISLSFVECGLDIIAAEVFTRIAPEYFAEAVDLFWVKRHPPDENLQLHPADIRRIRSELIALLERAPSELLVRPRFESASRAAAGTTLRFLEDEGGRFVTLEIETNDRTGLLLAVCQALFGEGVQIVGSKITSQAGRVSGRFDLVELSNRPIEIERRHIIKLAVLSAVSVDSANQQSESAE